MNKKDTELDLPGTPSSSSTTSILAAACCKAFFVAFNWCSKTDVRESKAGLLVACRWLCDCPEAARFTPSLSAGIFVHTHLLSQQIRDQIYLTSRHILLHIWIGWYTSWTLERLYWDWASSWSLQVEAFNILHSPTRQLQLKMIPAKR